MANFITWDPVREGSLYLPPLNDPVYAGPSVTTTIDGVNSGSSINQVIAETYRRSGGGVGLFKSVGDIIYASYFLSLKSSIDSIRNQEELGIYDWGELPVSGGLIKGIHLADLRQALATDMYYHHENYPRNMYYQYNQSICWKQEVSSVVNYLYGYAGTGLYIGVINTGSSYFWSKRIFVATLPSGAPMFTSGIMKIRIGTVYGSGYNILVYQTPGNYMPTAPVDSNDYYLTGTLVGSAPIASGDINIELSGCNFIPGANTFWITTDEAVAEDRTTPKNNSFIMYSILPGDSYLPTLKLYV